MAWGKKERVGLRMIPRLRTWVEGVMMEPSMLREKVWAERMRCLEYFRFIAVEFEKILLHP